MLITMFSDVTIGFIPDVYSVSEDMGSVNLVVGVLEGALERQVSVQFQTAPQSAEGEV